MPNFPCPSSWLTLLKKHRVIAVIRANKKNLARQMALTVAFGGIKLIEVTWNTPNAAELVVELRREIPDCIIGAGTLLNLQQMQQAVQAGSQFLFTPHIDPEIISAAVNLNIPIIPGALTPTEIVTAWTLGATCVKVFPIQAVGNVEYIKSLQAPLKQIPLIPTGGVTLENAAEFISSGAIAIGLSSELFPKHLVISEDWDLITQQTETLLQKIK
ncbi:bifunctional 4-hydroxy-2-oxoglutarate aldolase/2-dehydro-3-deoxy-phosphogluconate aldolase [Plectonema cf. radiosum LEGE 06105]|uniref:Bifunctional 4-hydroxy-2-oxoglutarate aldolase/2-dehydro-3-deoxy-phosphogluconate aldolase n=1 Tax=Plectonema cf. radiosum LEGE 06105 TaxID=945769 RepID=A0A8J7F4A5_9CYAN|nr:bifunctional 4-hydroxy-2-oxoglutarate aldolase/2-dehydro-3-deoxy-phosphogluconate aldolase [Plectonema radiosum]MBE9213185.1 bifunctional 4-hydroxy-2-oxoglutarate aldolase/2-dehydro-3-deoxy-phosphogluconate aldolase [Plectonema cf. radiosum LEGE 06105]